MGEHLAPPGRSTAADCFEQGLKSGHLVALLVDVRLAGGGEGLHQQGRLHVELFRERLGGFLETFLEVLDFLEGLHASFEELVDADLVVGGERIKSHFCNSLKYDSCRPK